MFFSHRMSGWQVALACRTAWCWRSSCIFLTEQCWTLGSPAVSGLPCHGTSSSGRSFFTTTTASRALCHATQVLRLYTFCESSSELVQSLVHYIYSLSLCFLHVCSRFVMVQGVQEAVWLYPVCGGSDFERASWSGLASGLLSPWTPLLLLFQRLHC